MSSSMGLEAPSLSLQRAEQGLFSPSPAGKKAIWSRVRLGSAGIKEGYKTLPTARRAHQADSRMVCVSGGWRSGKSLFAGMEALTWLPYADLIWFVAKDYDMARQEFGYLMEGAISAGLARPNDCHMPETRYQPCVMRGIPSKWAPQGCVVETRTLSDIRKLAAKPPDLVVVCEPGLIDNLKLVEELLWGRVSERRGMILMAGTSDESSEEWWEVFTRCSSTDPKVNLQGGRSFSIPTWQNLYRYPLGDQEREFTVYRELYGEEALMAHFGGVPASPRDLVLRDYWSESLMDEESVFDANRPTEIAIDPGFASHYAIEVVQYDLANGWDIHVVDEVAEQGKTHDEMKALCVAKPWWKHVQGGTSDPHAESHIFGGYPTTYYWPEIQLRTDHRLRVVTTVQAIKESMAPYGDRLPRLHVNPNTVKRLPWEAKHWRVDKMGNPGKGDCDATKALGYWLVDHFMRERQEAQDEDNVVEAKEWEFDPV